MHHQMKKTPDRSGAELVPREARRNCLGYFRAAVLATALGAAGVAV